MSQSTAKTPGAESSGDQSQLPFWKRSHFLDRMTLGELVSAYFQHYTIVAYLAVAVACVVGFAFFPASPWQTVLSIGAAVAVCTLVGAVNGAVIAGLKIQPFIVTLASMIGVRGLAKWLSNNENIDIGFGRDVAAQFAEIFRSKAVVIGSYAASAAAFWVLLSRTVFGRYVRAVGDNEKAAEYAGLDERSRPALERG